MLVHFSSCLLQKNIRERTSNELSGQLGPPKIKHFTLANSTSPKWQYKLKLSRYCVSGESIKFSISVKYYAGVLMTGKWLTVQSPASSCAIKRSCDWPLKQVGFEP